jgi:hypothetical protein
MKQTKRHLGGQAFQLVVAEQQALEVGVVLEGLVAAA